MGIIVSPLPVLSTMERMKTLALDSVPGILTKKAYADALDEFLLWFRNAPQELNKASVRRYLAELQERESRQKGKEGSPVRYLASSTINKHIAAIRRFVSEAADNNLLDHAIAESILRIKGQKRLGGRVGSWLSQEQAQVLLRLPDTTTLKGKRDQAILAVLLGAGLRRGEAAALSVDHLQQREGRWLIVNLEGKHGRIRSVPIASWIKYAIDRWTEATNIQTGFLFRPISRGGNITGEKISDQTVYDMLAVYVEILNSKLGLQNDARLKLAPHDMRRTFAKLAHKGKASIEQIQKTLGHASIQTTERYLGTDQDITDAPSDHIGLRIH